MSDSPQSWRDLEQRVEAAAIEAELITGRHEETALRVGTLEMDLLSRRVTRDGTEMLIPNDRFMTEGLVNWSRSDRVVRFHAPFGVSYNTTNLKEVQELAVDAAKSVNRVVNFPAPVCNLMEYGDSSVNFDLRFWISDPMNGRANVTSELLLAIWDRFHEHGIEIPYPQRDLHLVSPEVIRFGQDAGTAPGGERADD